MRQRVTIDGRRLWGITLSLALCLVPLALSPHIALANHESSAQPPLWTPLDDVERMATIEVPGGMVTVPAGEFLMGSDPRKDRAAGPQEFPQHRVYLDGFQTPGGARFPHESKIAGVRSAASHCWQSSPAFHPAWP